MSLVEKTHWSDFGGFFLQTQISGPGASLVVGNMLPRKRYCCAMFITNFLKY